MSGDDKVRVRKARVTVKDLARDLSLSTSTISRAFYDDAVIAPSTRTAVLTRAAEIGYAPNPLARSLITKRGRLERLARRRGQASLVLSARRGHRSRGDAVVRGRQSVRTGRHARPLLQPPAAQRRRL